MKTSASRWVVSATSIVLIVLTQSSSSHPAARAKTEILVKNDEFFKDKGFMDSLTDYLTSDQFRNPQPKKRTFPIQTEETASSLSSLYSKVSQMTPHGSEGHPQYAPPPMPMAAKTWQPYQYGVLNSVINSANEPTVQIASAPNVQVQPAQQLVLFQVPQDQMVNKSPRTLANANRRQRQRNQRIIESYQQMQQDRESWGAENQGELSNSVVIAPPNKYIAAQPQNYYTAQASQPSAVYYAPPSPSQRLSAFYMASQASNPNGYMMSSQSQPSNVLIAQNNPQTQTLVMSPEAFNQYREQQRQKSTFKSKPLIAKPIPAYQTGSTSLDDPYLRENEVDKPTEGIFGKLGQLYETSRKIMYLPKGVADILGTAMGYAEKNPYMGDMMDKVADTLFGSTKFPAAPVDQPQPKNGYVRQIIIANNMQPSLATAPTLITTRANIPIPTAYVTKPSDPKPATQTPKV